MTRPRDDSGRPLPAAWRRLPEAADLELAGVLAISADGRACFLDHKRKLELARKAINHVVDGDVIPKFVEGGGRCSRVLAGLRRCGEGRAARHRRGGLRS